MAFTFHNELFKDSEESGKNAYSSAQLQRAVDVYSSSFGNSVPLELLTAAARAFRSRELMSLLLDKVKANDPIQNWSEFTLSFLNDSDIG